MNGSFQESSQRRDNVSLDIRTYRNTDGPELCAVFSAHYQAAGLPCTMTPLSLELCILAKAFFSPAQMLVAEKDGQVVGFLLLGFEPEDPLLTASSTRAVVSSLCVRPCEQEDRIASELLASSVSRCGQMGCEQLSFSPPPPASPFMAGLAPGDGMIGGPEIDFRLTRWLRASGWVSG